MKNLSDYAILEKVGFSTPCNPMAENNVLTFDVDIPVFEFEHNGHKCYAFGCLVNDQQALIYPKSFFQPQIYRDNPKLAVTPAMAQFATCTTLGKLRRLLSDRSIRITEIHEARTQFGIRKFPVFEWSV